MKSQEDIRKFVETARENGFQISEQHAADLGGYVEIAEAAYEAIREIDSSEFEPAKIFVPTASERNGD